MNRRAAIGAFSLALTAGWNLSSVGAVAERSAHAYGVGLAVIGLFTTALLATHAGLQVPVGRLCDRYGARAVGGAGLVVVAVACAIALLWRDPWFAIALRAVAGAGTAAAFVAGSDYVRSTIGSPFAQGMYGAGSMASGGLALALVPLWGTWQAPFATGALAAVAGIGGVVLAPREARRVAHPKRRPGVWDRELLPLAAMHSASFGLSVVLGNWVVTLLHRAGGVSEHVAGAAGASILLVGVVSRPLGGHFAHHTGLLRVSFVTGGAAVGVLAIAKPLPLAIAAAAVAGLAAGIPFAAAFGGAAELRPEAPGAAVGFVNTFGAGTILIGTPLVGLGFSLPGEGRVGFLVVGVLWAAAAFAVPKVTNQVRPAVEPGSTSAEPGS